MTEKLRTEKQRLVREQVICALEQMTILQLSDLVKELEEKFGSRAAAVIRAAALIPGWTPPLNEKVEWDVELKDFGAKKIQVIKAVRAITHLGLREAKGLVEDIPSTVLSDVSREIAEDAKHKLEAEGALIELR